MIMKSRFYKIIHYSRFRARFKVLAYVSNWQEFSKSIAKLSNSTLIFNTRKSTSSIIVTLKDESDDIIRIICEKINSVIADLKILEPCIPLTPVTVVSENNERYIRLLNIPSLLISICLFILFLSLLLPGFLLLFIPFSPGSYILILATLLLEIIFSLRKPFTV